MAKQLGSNEQQQLPALPIMASRRPVRRRVRRQHHREKRTLYARPREKTSRPRFFPASPRGGGDSFAQQAAEGERRGEEREGALSRGPSSRQPTSQPAAAQPAAARVRTRRCERDLRATPEAHTPRALVACSRRETSAWSTR
ncbi:hypothetical protein ON010_g2698 [Phytophthora cinnamomi]|nr:hypothetical protein ON010_g2698 [Phytophthora cinnamomi]